MYVWKIFTVWSWRWIFESDVVIKRSCRYLKFQAGIGEPEIFIKVYKRAIRSGFGNIHIASVDYEWRFGPVSISILEDECAFVSFLTVNIQNAGVVGIYHVVQRIRLRYISGHHPWSRTAEGGVVYKSVDSSCVVEAEAVDSTSVYFFAVHLKR